MHTKILASVTAALCLLCLHTGGGAVRIVQPPEGGSIEFIPDIPLWVRLEKGEGECFDILLDGESQTITCDDDTILSVQPRPGEHLIEVVPTFLPSSHGPMASSSFSVYADPNSRNRIPPWMASADGSVAPPSSC